MSNLKFPSDALIVLNNTVGAGSGSGGSGTVTVSNIPPGAASDSPVLQIVTALNAIGTDTTPVPVTANTKTGNYALAAIGSPSTADLTQNKVVYSNPFVPVGEQVTVEGKFFKSGGIALGADAKFWLECDPSGGTSYVPVIGSLKTLQTEISQYAATFPSFAYTFGPTRGGNWRVAICLGAVSGTASGATGFNMFVVT